MTKLLSQQLANQQLAKLVSIYDTNRNKSTTSFHRNRKMSWESGEKIAMSSQLPNPTYNKKKLALLVTKRVKLAMDKSSEELKMT
jgi:hypothetical protein